MPPGTRLRPRPPLRRPGLRAAPSACFALRRGEPPELAHELLEQLRDRVLSLLCRLSRRFAVPARARFVDFHGHPRRSQRVYPRNRRLTRFQGVPIGVRWNSAGYIAHTVRTYIGGGLMSAREVEDRG